MSAFAEGEQKLPRSYSRREALVVVAVMRMEREKMAQTEQKDEIDEIALRFAAMPAFPLAVREYIVTLASMRQRLRFLNKVISHNARWRVAGFLMYLNADRERFGAEGGATYTNLLEMCCRRAEIKPRVLKTVLALLQITGSVKAMRKEGDRRSKFYQPTERMHEFMRQWMGKSTRVLDILEPEKRRSQLLRDDPGFCDRFLVSSGRAHLTALPLVERMPEYVAFFGSREGAAAVADAVLLADLDGSPIPSRAELAKLYGAPAPTPRLRASYSKWVSIELAFYSMHMQSSQNEIF
jgi:hypothetical protein